MERITEDTTLDEIKDWLVELEYECKKKGDNSLIIDKNNVSTFMSKTKSNNYVFFITLEKKEGLDELTLLRKVNEINHQILSGCVSADDECVHFSFSLVRPFGMGKKGFSIFLDYNIKLMGFIVEKLGLSEITR